MSTSHAPRSTSAMGGVIGGAGAGSGREKTYFEQQRELLIGEIAMSFEHVLANINKLNRNLEAVTAVGNEFSSVEALWSQFENVMAKDNNNNTTTNNNKDGGGNKEKGEQQEGGNNKRKGGPGGGDEDEEEEEEVKMDVDMDDEGMEGDDMED